MAQQTKPYIPVHPGELIKEEIESRGISQKKMSEIIGISYTMLNEILNGKRNITAETAILFEAALNVNAEMLVNMQSSYSLQIAKKSDKLSTRFSAIRRECAATML